MNEEIEDPILEEAFAKAVESLAEHMDSGIIIGTIVNEENASTFKWSRPWGNSFAVSKMIETQAQECKLIDTQFVMDDDD